MAAIVVYVLRWVVDAFDEIEKVEAMPTHASYRLKRSYHHQHKWLERGINFGHDTQYLERHMFVSEVHNDFGAVFPTY